MRPSCTYCARKHLAQALILLNESEQGYPEHYWLAVGHLAEASDELIQDYRAMALEIRAERKNMESVRSYRIPIMSLIQRCGELDKPTTVAEIHATRRVAEPADIPAAEKGAQELVEKMRSWKAAASLPFPPEVAVLYDHLKTLSPGTPEHHDLVREIALAEDRFSGLAHYPSADHPSAPIALSENDLTNIEKVKARLALPPIVGLPDTGANSAVGLPALQNVAPKGCGGCDKAKQRKLAQEAMSNRWRDENASGAVTQRVVIMCTLTSFDPSYSLVSVTLDQARAAALLPRTTVHVFVHVDANLERLPADLPRNIEVSTVLPHVHAKNDEMHENIAISLSHQIRNWLDRVGPAVVITHDLVFQAGLLNYARAFHLLGNIPGYHFFHMIHSSVGVRPKAEAAQWRASIPDGHTMVAVNIADLPYLHQYYQAPADRFVSLPNPRDVRSFFSMPAIAQELVTKHALHLATYLQIYPLSAPRMSAKGLTKVIDVFKQLLAGEGGDPAAVRLVVADAHANGKEGQDQKTLMKRYAQDIGLPAECLVFVSDHLPDEHQSAGLDRDSIRSLMQLANLFIFPTTSEAGSLVLMEAALSGNLLVLNESLPCLKDYIGAQDAIWVPFGSVKEPGESVDMSFLAGRIEASLMHSRTNQAKQVIMRRNCLEAYAKRLCVHLGLAAEIAAASTA